MHRMKLPFTPQAHSMEPPFLRPGVSTDQVTEMIKRPASGIKALCISGTLAYVSMYVHNRSRIDTHVITFHVLYVYAARAPAYLKGGSPHKPTIGKSLGYHPTEPKSGQRSPKKGLGLGHVFTTPHTVVA